MRLLSSLFHSFFNKITPPRKSGRSKRFLRKLCEMLDHLLHTIVVCVLLGSKGGGKLRIGDVHTLKLTCTGVQILAMVADLEAEGRIGRLTNEVHQLTGVLVVVVLVLQTLLVVCIDHGIRFLVEVLHQSGSGRICACRLEDTADLGLVVCYKLLACARTSDCVD